MKNTILTVITCLFLSFSNIAQSNNTNLKVGDTFTIGETKMNNYKYIKFPKDNFIIKKGGFANYNNIVNKKVEITAIKEKKDGEILATIQLKSGRKFFGKYKYIKVNIKGAISSKELLTD